MKFYDQRQFVFFLIQLFCFDWVFLYQRERERTIFRTTIFFIEFSIFYCFFFRFEWDTFDYHSGIYSVHWKLFDNYTGSDMIHGISHLQAQGDASVIICHDKYVFYYSSFKLYSDIFEI